MRTTRRAARGIERGWRFLDGARVSGMRGGVRARVRRGEMRRLACAGVADTHSARVSTLPIDFAATEFIRGLFSPTWGSSRWGASVQLAPVVAPHTTEMALRRAAALLARLPSTSMQPQLAPAVFTRGMSGGLERFKEGQPVQTKRPAYDERDTPHTDKWLEVRPHDGSPPQLCTAFSDVSTSASRTLWRGHRPGARSRASTPPNPRPPTNPHA
jgi:hypothetical protein